MTAATRQYGQTSLLTPRNLGLGLGLALIPAPSGGSSSSSTFSGNPRLSTSSTVATAVSTPSTPPTPSAPRKWDDPPEAQPFDIVPALGSLSDAPTTMLFTKTSSLASHFSREVQSLAFSASDSHLIAQSSKVPNHVSTSSTIASTSTLALWTLPSAERLRLPHMPRRGFRVEGVFAASPSPTATGSALLACAFHRHDAPPKAEPYAADGTKNARVATADGPPRLEVFDLTLRRRTIKADLPVRAPLAWSPDGATLAGVSTRDPSRILVIPMAGAGAKAGVKVGKVLAVHGAEVTQLGFTSDGTAVVSAARDGAVRLTGVTSGRTVRKVQVEAKGEAGMMQVSNDGLTVVLVWGRDVMVWWLKTGLLTGYNLDAMRYQEGWPLAVSPDAKYLACRTEDGFDVMEVESGQFCGEVEVRDDLITAAAFTHDGKRVAVGDYVGQVRLYDIKAGRIQPSPDGGFEFNQETETEGMEGSEAALRYPLGA
ncbi:Quino protein amine dehydrogenase [Lasiosphaeris hirsuta]|uniref:Quino protein amine dehydrogenase n=1 Tax=Lasiosphaeris hirsuta TaxID=260670 RepID=A0AA40E7Y9_9PEZI|nr:Quino protein amine dehydrogenase [Lasiosphaeris hirsuta]